MSNNIDFKKQIYNSLAKGTVDLIQLGSPKEKQDMHGFT